MIGVRLTGMVAEVEPGPDGIVPVVAYTPPDYQTRADADLAALASLRRKYAHLSDEEWNEAMLDGPLSVYAGIELEDRRDREPRRALMLSEAEALIEDGLAEPVEMELGPLPVEA